MNIKKYCFELDLKKSANSKKEYERHFNNLRPDISKIANEFEIENLEIYFSDSCLIMLLEKIDNYKAQLNREDVTFALVKNFVDVVWKKHLKIANDGQEENWLFMNPQYQLKN